MAFAGGTTAYVLSLGLTPFLLDLFNAGQRYTSLHVAPDTSVLLFTFSVCSVTALIAGLYPAWQASRTDATSGLKGAALQGVRRSVVRRSLILVQVALAIVLLFGASLFTHSLRNLRVTNLGYDIDHVLTVTIEEHNVFQALMSGVSSGPKIAQILNRVRQLPFVESAAFSNPGVLSGNRVWDENVKVRENSRQIAEVPYLTTTPGYLSTMRIPLLRGRDFGPADRKGEPAVVIVNQRLANEIAPGQDAIGKHLEGLGRDVEVIGVTGNSKYSDVREAEKPIAYLAVDQQNPIGGALEIRFRGAAAVVEQQVRSIVKDAGLEVPDVAALELLRDGLLAQDRLLTFLSSLFGALGTALALVGVYGLISYSVSRRTREVGIRVSVGAHRSDVLWLFLREGALLVAGGVLIGLPIALALAGFLRKLLFEVSTSDPVGIAATIALILAGGLAACLIPARRATRVNPVQALRYE